MANQDIIKELSKIVGRNNVLFSRRDLLAYSYDATQRQEMPELVVFCHSTAEVSGVMKAAHRKRMPVVPRGAGTGISGGTVPIKGGIVLELSRMNRIIAIDTANRRAVVEPGVVNLDLQEALAPSGFIYPPDPASQKSCTLGGNVGENAGGPLCFQYGVTSKYVCGIEVVLPSGEIVEFGGAVEDTPGYDLRGLFIGSEGTLGVATKLLLQIVPASEASKTMLAIFDALEDAGQTVSDIISAGIIPAALELMDKKMCWAIEESLHAGYPTDAEGVLLIEVAGLANGLERQVNDISEICERNRVRQVRFAKTGAERDALWKGRKGAFGSVARICPPYLVNDGTVPRNKLVEALLKVQGLPAKYHVQIASVAHAGDGNLHPLILYDCNNPDEVKAARKTGEEVLDICLALGGTISGEHGIGLEKLAAMYRMFSPADLAAMRKVKQVFDPDDILNPGKLLPPEVEPVKDDNAEKTVSQTLVDRITGIVCAGNIKTSDKVDSAYHVDGLVPDIVVFPSTTQQVSQIVKTGNQYRKAIVPLGSCSKLQAGPCVSAADIILTTKNLNQIVDLDTGNSTVGVQVGMVISELQKELAKHRLFLPLDPITENSTIGGVLAANDNGPRRFMYSTARDLILGLTVVTPTGDIIRPGGKTMKNVAGLDLCKIFIGSWGTLGVITEAVLRLFPLPEVNRTYCLIFSGVGDAMQLVSRILNSSLTPAAIELIDWVAGARLKCDHISPLKEGEILLLINIEGSSEIVERHLKEISAIAQEWTIQKVTLEGARAIEVWYAYHSMRQSFLSDVQHGISGKASVPLSKQAEMFRAVKEVSKKYGVETGITASSGNGILYAYIPADNDDVIRLVGDLKLAAQNIGGFFTVEHAPLQIRKNNSIWLRPDAYELIERLKRAFDPNNVLNPGKVGGGL
ncbi:MAG: FAD-binding protein [Chloroflexi bacterium]|nr:FAD-binding protein [Chloroflexota bacterium]